MTTDGTPARVRLHLDEGEDATRQPTSQQVYARAVHISTLDKPCRADEPIGYRPVLPPSRPPEPERSPHSVGKILLTCRHKVAAFSPRDEGGRRVRLGVHDTHAEAQARLTEWNAASAVAGFLGRLLAIAKGGVNG